MRPDDSPDHGQAKAAAFLVGIRRLRAALEGVEDRLGVGLADAGAAVFDAEAMHAVGRCGLDRQRARRGVPQGVFQQGQQRLADADGIADCLLRLQRQGQGKALFQQGRFAGFHHGHHLLPEVGFLQLHPQVPALGQADHAQVFDQPAQAFDLDQQAGEQCRIGLEDAFGQALQAAAQDGDGRAQFMRDGGVPEDAFLLHAFEPFRHRVEVVDQLGRFSQRMVVGGRAGGEVALRDLAQAGRHRVQRREDAPGQADGDPYRNRQPDQCRDEDPAPFGRRGQPTVRRRQAGRVEHPQRGVEDVGAEHDHHHDGQYQDGDRADDLAAQPPGAGHKGEDVHAGLPQAPWWKR